MLLLNYKMKDPFGNKESLKVYLKDDNTLRYNLHSGWGPTGIRFALTNLILKDELPISINKFDTVGDLGGDILYRVKRACTNFHEFEVINHFPKQNSLSS